MTLDIELIPVEGYPGDQRQRMCDACEDGVYEIKEEIWDNAMHLRVSMRCVECGDITVKTRDKQMFRWRLTLRK